ncbi:hypothetical protein [Actinomycetospora sp. CA-084318]|uniref:hypothetical protein n=1 Tax=Actinomycetospora sp. CA-084318 TaxID=3239892 RepID=UPI003D96E0E8
MAVAHDAFAPSDVRTLTIFLAPAGAAGGILEVFTDLATVGLLRRFLWVQDPGSAERSTIAALDVSGPVREAARLTAILSAEAPEQVCVCVIVPLDTPAVLVSEDSERVVVGTIERALGVARVTRVRCLVLSPGTRAPADVVARQGWHNVLVAPEESRGPWAPSTPLDAPDMLDVARSAAPTVAAVAGLWAGLHGRPPTGPGVPGVRAARAFYRRIEADEVEQALRAAVLSTEPQLPMPHDPNVTVVPHTDPAGGCRWMAEKLWDRYRDDLYGQRRKPAVAELEAVGWRVALLRFLRFIGAALRNVPADFYRATVNVGGVAAAKRVQRVVYGQGDPAYLVVANGMTAHGLPAGWHDLGQAAERIDDQLIASREHEAFAPADLTALWNDFVDGALTLADAGERNRTGMGRLTTPEGYPAVVRQAADCAPAPEDDFVEVPGALAAETGIHHVVPGDILGAEVLRQRLAHVATARPELSYEANTTRDRLDSWLYTRSRSYTVQVGTAIAKTLRTVSDEIPGHLNALLAATHERDEVDARRSRLLVWLLRVLGVLSVLGVVTGPVLAAPGVIRWPSAVVVVVVPVLCWVGALLWTYLDERRRLYHDLSRRREVLSQAEAARFNLREALRALRRLAEAYEQYLEWSRIVGVVLRRPFGPEPPGGAPRVDVAYGLPLTTQLAAAAGVDDQEEIVNQLRTRLFSTGWLTAVWDAHRHEAIETHLQQGRSAHPGSLLDLRGGLEHSSLRAWSKALVERGPSSTVGDQVWVRGMEQLRDPERDLGRLLLDSLRVVPAGGAPVPVSRFLDRVGEDGHGREDEFHPDHFSPAGRTAGVAVVREHLPSRSTIGLSQVAGVVQYTEVRPATDFAVTQTSGEGSSGEPDEPTPAVPPLGGPSRHRVATTRPTTEVSIPRAPRGFS